MLAKADLIIWVGPELESSLSGIIDNIDDDKEVITLMKVENIEKLSLTQFSKEQQIKKADQQACGCKHDDRTDMPAHPPKDISQLKLFLTPDRFHDLILVPFTRYTNRV